MQARQLTEKMWTDVQLCDCTSPPILPLDSSLNATQNGPAGVNGWLLVASVHDMQRIILWLTGIIIPISYPSYFCFGSQASDRG